MLKNFIINEEPDKIFEPHTTILTFYSHEQQYKLLTYTMVLHSKSETEYTNK